MELALIFVLPIATAVASPDAIVATPVFEDAQVAVVVRSCVLPSLYWPVAVNCCVPGNVMVALAGLTEIDVRGAETMRKTVVVSVVFPDVPVRVIV